MKSILFALTLLALSGNTWAQKYMTRTGKIKFDATSPKSPEKIEGINNEIAAVLDAKGDFLFQAMVKSFKFEKALMQEHFNENYMESSAFPKADFKGKISNITEVNFTKDGTYKVTVAGKLTIHGVAQEVAVPGTITVKGKDVTATAKFTVKLQDYKISVPTMVADKLAKEATISVDAILNQK
jgi:hypothetical protein